MKTIVKSNFANPHYFELIQTIHGTSDVAKRYLRDTAEGLNYLVVNKNITTVFFHLLEKNNLVGHLALICTTKSEAYFGFFELTNYAYINEFWQTMLHEAKLKGIKKIFGPVNGTVWHPYRVISEMGNEPFFIKEPLSPVGYFNLLKSCSPVHIIEFHSAYRTHFDLILEHTKNSLSALNQEDFKIIRKSFSSDLLKIIYELTLKIFSANPGFVSLDFEDFVKLYSNTDKEDAEIVIFLALQKNLPVGFSYNIRYSNNLIMKTIGVLPDLQEKGFGNAMVYEVHKFAKETEIKKVIYALIRSDNRVKHFPKDDAVIFRKYAALIYSIL